MEKTIYAKVRRKVLIVGAAAMLALAVTPTASNAVEAGGKCETPPTVIYGPSPKLECPALSIDALALAGPRSVTTAVATSRKAPVAVSGIVTVPRIGKKARTQIQLSGPSQTVEPGRIGRFELVFPGSLQSALQALPSKRFLILTVSVSATDEIDRVTTTSSVVQLKGQAKPKKKAGGSR